MEHNNNKEPLLLVPKNDNDEEEELTLPGSEDETNSSSTCDMFQCCRHPETTASHTWADCWTAIKNLLLFSSLKKQQQEEEEVIDSENKGKEHDNACVSPATKPFSLEETTRLSLIFKLVRQSYQELLSSKTEELTSVLSLENSSTGASFLSELAKAASKVAMNRQTNNDNTNNLQDNDVDDDDNPEVAIQRLLQAGKRTEAMQKKQTDRLNRFEILINIQPNLLQFLADYNGWQVFVEDLFSSSNTPTSNINDDVDELTTEAAAVAAAEDIMKEQSFQSLLQQLLGRKGTKPLILFFLLNMKPHQKENEDHLPALDSEVKDYYRLIMYSFQLSLAHAFLMAPSSEESDAIPSSLGNDNNPYLKAMFRSFQAYYQHKRFDTLHATKLDLFLQWNNQQTPSLLTSLPVLMNAILFPSFVKEEDTTTSNIISSPSSGGWLLPRLDHPDGSSLLATKPSLLFAVACTLPPTIKHHRAAPPIWNRLYSTHSEGFNWTTLEHSLAGYNGPTLLLVEALDKESGHSSHQIFGAFASQPWTKQTSPDYYGNADSFLFQLHPNFQVYRAKEYGVANYQYFYSDNKNQPTTTPTTLASSSKDNDVKKHVNGLGLGGSRKRPRFFISSSLDSCYLGANDATFDSNTITSTSTSTSSSNENDRQQQNNNVPPQQNQALWDLMTLEVWGVGGESAMRALARHRTVQDTNLQKARQVDKAAFLNDFRSGLIESKMFAHREEMRNRDGGCLLDCHDEEEDDGKKWQIGAPKR